MLGEQLPYVLAWLKVAREAMLDGVLRPGQSLVLCGPKNCGKSFTQEHIITPILGGRSADPFDFMAGETNFNSELFAAEHWMINDQVPPDDPVARRKVGAYMRQVASNDTGRCHGKNLVALKLPLFARLSISCNDDERSLLVPPPLDESLEGKVILCATQRPSFCWPTNNRQRQSLLAALEAEYPGCAYFLDSYRIPDAITDQRYGVAGYQDPAIARKLSRIGQDFELLELAREAIQESRSETFPFEGTSSEIFKLIWETEHLRDGLRRITSYPEGLGRIFSRLTDAQTPGICRRLLAGRTVYEIERAKD